MEFAYPKQWQQQIHLHPYTFVDALQTRSLNFTGITLTESLIHPHMLRSSCVIWRHLHISSINSTDLGRILCAVSFMHFAYHKQWQQHIFLHLHIFVDVLRTHSLNVTWITFTESPTHSWPLVRTFGLKQRVGMNIICQIELVILWTLQYIRRTQCAMKASNGLSYVMYFFHILRVVLLFFWCGGYESPMAWTRAFAHKINITPL